MNEVRSTTLASQSLAAPTSSKAVKNTPTGIAASAKDLPGEAGTTEKIDGQPQSQRSSAQVLEIALAKANDYVRSMQRDLQFSVDKDLDQTVIKVLDGDSGELIRQIPEDIFLELARRLENNGQFNLLNTLS